MCVLLTHHLSLLGWTGSSGRNGATGFTGRPGATGSRGNDGSVGRTGGTGRSPPFNNPSTTSCSDDSFVG